mmetsp:Transcript_15546/g.33909  ORF Transcript_15546/g.33909 Transcript_15546/m.33909 type:complete len:383 (+) Transcript_15546:191-1339(+)
MPRHLATAHPPLVAGSSKNGYVRHPRVKSSVKIKGISLLLDGWQHGRRRDRGRGRRHRGRRGHRAAHPHRLLRDALMRLLLHRKLPRGRLPARPHQLLWDTLTRLLLRRKLPRRRLPIRGRHSGRRSRLTARPRPLQRNALLGLLLLHGIRYRRRRLARSRRRHSHRLRRRPPTGLVRLLHGKLSLGRRGGRHGPRRHRGRWGARRRRLPRRPVILRHGRRGSQGRGGRRGRPSRGSRGDAASQGRAGVRAPEAHLLVGGIHLARRWGGLSVAPRHHAGDELLHLQELIRIQPLQHGNRLLQQRRRVASPAANRVCRRSVRGGQVGVVGLLLPPVHVDRVVGIELVVEVDLPHGGEARTLAVAVNHLLSLLVPCEAQVLRGG